MELPRELRRSAPAALLLDFDGVILDSVRVKLGGFMKIYENEDPAKLQQIREHQRSHGGVTRRVKFRHFETQVFGREASDEKIEGLSQTFTRLVQEGVLECPFIPGAQELLDRTLGRAAMHLVSGTPDEDLKDIVERRGLSRYFASVQGAPIAKRDAFAGIVRDYGYAPGRLLAIGDAMTEHDAAVALGIPFLGVTYDSEFAMFPPGVPCVRTLEGLADALGYR